MSLKSKIFKQHDIGNKWGFFMQIIQQEAIVIQSIILTLTVVTAASVLQIRGYEVPIWLLVAVIAVILAIGGVGIYLVGMPSYFSAFNDQFYKHNNPLVRDVKENAKKIDAIMKHFGIEIDDED